MPSAEFDAVMAALREQPPSIPEAPGPARVAIDEMMGSAPMADGVREDDVTAGDRPARWIVPPGEVDDRAVLYLHGGAFRIGSIRAYRPLASQLAVALGIPLLVLEYRLAPEDPFPAAVDDAVAAWRWLLGTGRPAARMAVMGDSAGGGLTMSMLLALREAGLPRPGAAVCLSPLVDLTRSGDSYVRNAAHDPFFDRAAADRAVADYLPGGDPRDPQASPVFADLSGLPPVLVHASDREVLTDDAVLLARRIEECGGPVTLALWPGMTHVWHAMTPYVPEAREAVAEVSTFLDLHLA